MTDEMMTLRALLEKSSDADLLREMISFTAQRLMELEVEGLTGAAYGERSAERMNQRKAIGTGCGRHAPARWSCESPSCARAAIPGLPGAAPPGREGARRGGAGGVRAWRLDPLSRRSDQSMGMTGISKSQVSRLCEEIDERVKAFLSRPIEGDWPYLWIDATYVKARESGRIVSAAVIVAVGVNRDGRREVLGMESDLRRPRPSGPSFCSSSPGAVCAASSW